MMQYVNRFSCATNNMQNEFVLNFSQEHPTIDEVGNITGVDKNEIASFVMSAECARALLSAMQQIIIPSSAQTLKTDTNSEK